MAIAILGWGSLLWQKNSNVCGGEDEDILQIKEAEWNEDGPTLPIEFCKKSSRDRITLVISKKYGSPCKTYWATSKFDDFDRARRNLQCREGNKEGDKIYYIRRHEGALCVYPELPPEDGNLFAEIRKWLDERPYLNGVLWAGFAADEKLFGEKKDYEKNLRLYLQNQCDRKSKHWSCIKEYFEKAPGETKTAGRTLFTKEFSTI